MSDESVIDKKAVITVLTVVVVALLGCVLSVPSDDTMISGAGRQLTGQSWAGPVAAALLPVRIENKIFYKELYVGGQLVATGYLGTVKLEQ